MQNRLQSALRSAAESYLPAGAKDAIRRKLARVLKDRVVTYCELVDSEGVETWYFDRERTYTFDEPEYYTTIPDQISKLFGEHIAHQPYVFELRNAQIVGDVGLIRTQGGEFGVFNYDHSQSPEAKDDAALALAYDVLESISRGVVPVSIGGSQTPDTRYDCAVSLLNKWATNYSHWTEELLPLLEGVQHYADQTGRDPMLLIPPDPPEFIPDSLKVLGYSPDDYVEFTGDVAEVDRLVVPSPRRYASNTGDDYIRMLSGLEWLREQVFKGIGGRPDGERTKLLISREDADVRRMVNREAVQRVLEERGFQTVVLTELSYREQKDLFARADVIVGVHGAGLNEIVFAPDAAVLELYGDYIVPTFYEIAHGFDLPYGCIRCEDIGGDVFVDTDELLRGIDALEGTRRPANGEAG